MRILLITPGSGDSFYCGNCLRDNVYASSLRDAGHEVVVMPLYLPVNKQFNQNDVPVFFGAISYYMSQKFSKSGRLSKYLSKIFDRSTFFNVAAKQAGSTRVKGNEEMTISMIEADEASYIHYANELIDWIEHHEKPEIIHLSNALIIGLAKHLKARLSIPIVCSLQDEDCWIDKMVEPYRSRCWNSMNEKIEYVDRFISVSHYYANFMSSRLHSLSEVDVVYPGVNSEHYRQQHPPIIPSVGFISKMCSECGLDILVDAFLLLKKREVIPTLRLSISGGYTADDRKFVRKMKRKLKPYINDVCFQDDFLGERRKEFFEEISVLCVPVRFNEAFSLYISESYAAGVPVVEPHQGAFPEILKDSGVTYSPNNAEALAKSLEQILCNESLYNAHRKQTIAKANSLYNHHTMVRELLTSYRNAALSCEKR